MRYTWPKFKLCRREWINLFWTEKYDVKKRRKLPWQHWANMPRLSEYGKLLRNKQVFKRIYALSEKQFKRIVMDLASKYAKNKWLWHDKAVVQFLERRLDSIVLKAWLAKTIMQARQMVVHGHFLLNWKKHNVPSYFVVPGDVIEVKEKLKSSSAYTNAPVNTSSYNVPAWLKTDKSTFKVDVLDLPRVDDIKFPVDVLKVVEYYARS